MNPRAIALQGVGFAALLVAVQGFAPVVELVESSSNGGGMIRAREKPADSRILRTRQVRENDILFLQH